MPLLFSNPFFNEDSIRALNWTLIHSLWQGMLLAMVAGIIVFFTKTASPAVRYNLLTAAMLIFMTGIAVTFSREIIHTPPAEQMVQVIPSSTRIAAQTVMGPLVAENRISMPGKTVDFFNANAGWIVLTWLLIIVLQCVQLTAGLYSVYQLKRRQTFSPGEYWNKKITELSRQLQINKRVRLLQSGIAMMPAVIGYFKPVILFPAGILASLPANEVEAILIHELAHIRRKDFLVNVLQHIVEIIFFFNPAVRWVSSLIKLERENCCDDIAVSQTDNKRNYINALIAFQGFNLQLTSPVINGFAGEKNHLINRVKRIIYNNNKTLSNMEKKFLAAGMIITSVFIFAFSTNNLRQNAVQKKNVSQSIPGPVKIIAALPAFADTVPVREPNRVNELQRKIITTVNGKKYTIVSENNQVTELYVNNKKIPADKIGEYKTITNKILKQSASDAGRSDKEWEEAARGMEQSKKELEESKIEIEQSKKQMEEEREQAMRDMEQSKIEMEQAKKEMAEDMEQAKKEMEQSKIEMEQAKKEMAEEMERAKIEMEQAKKDMAQSGKDMEQSNRDMRESQKLQERIIADFIKENIIKDKKGLSSYKLSNEALIVNGVKQSDALHKIFKDKYVKSNNWTIEFNYNNEDVK